MLGQNLQRVDVKFLNQYPEFVEFHTAKRKEKAGEESDEKPALESLEDNYEQIKQDLIQELVVQIKECSPDFFERLVVDLLIRMGYGGSREDAGKAIGGSGDAGIDGVINEDRLGLDSIYIQAKRWKEETTVSRPEIQKFAGALLGRKAKKGVFITTSKFSKEAIDYADGLENKIVLIDGEQLAEYMIDFNVGVTRIASYDIRRVDLDYFIDE